ncbi:hypothetical protein NHP21005_02840 [Helicobacter sp. NHP21005]|uniref:glycosyltransferase family 4 protein n=1 Tax=Helicobacter felistomachi TaxID=3040201 RepID=UPI0025737910|nr:glycosyltransferase family 1 protein [Helicobacter sp. NHP21005]BEG56596.1 hypothetical protein NHP21005_02840 [Helicobacter sp. NHP21005]
MKRVVIGVTSLLDNLSGIGVYTLTLVQALERHFKDRDDVELKLFVRYRLFDSLEDFQNRNIVNFSDVIPPRVESLSSPPSRSFFERFRSLTPRKFITYTKHRLLGILRFFYSPLVKILLPEKFYYFLQYRFLMDIAHKRACKNFSWEVPDLYIEPGGACIPMEAKKLLGCIHDMPLCDEATWCMTEEERSVWQHYHLQKISHCDQAICFTETVKKDILKTFGWSETKVHVIYHGMRAYRQTSEDLPPNLGEFILVVGKARRKNIRRLIQAFELLPTILQRRFKIVITGLYNSRIDRKEDAVISSKNFVVNLGYVSDSLLSTLYAHARLLWWGSLAEGFGLPMLEAMHAGCVVLSSDVSCMPEILGDAGIYCNPYNAQDIAKQLEKALMDEALRTECIAKGFERVKRFDFEESMRKHIEIVEKMLD